MGTYTAMVRQLADQDQEITRLRREIEALEGALREVRDVINVQPPEALGSVPSTADSQGWWIRDELVHRITAALGGDR